MEAAQQLGISEQLKDLVGKTSKMYNKKKGLYMKLNDERELKFWENINKFGDVFYLPANQYAYEFSEMMGNTVDTSISEAMMDMIYDTMTHLHVNVVFEPMPKRDTDDASMW